jgi:hypothetical protein
MKLIYLKLALKSDSLMYLLVSKFRFLKFRLLLSRVAPHLQFITTNCLIELRVGILMMFRIEGIRPMPSSGTSLPLTLHV